MRDLAERLNRDIHESTNRLIELHGLEGNAGDEVLTRLADHYVVTKQVTKAAPRSSAAWSPAPSPASRRT